MVESLLGEFGRWGGVDNPDGWGIGWREGNEWHLQKVPEPRLHTPSQLGKIKVPVLVIAGTEDDVVPDVGEKIEPIADGEQVRLEVMDG